MTWIKRNLFFFIGTALAVGLLAAAGVYGFGNWQRNETDLNALNEAYKTLRTINNENPSPGNDKVNNIQTAREQEQQLRDWIQQAEQYFQPIPPIPNPTNSVVTSEAFAAALRRTIDQLQHEADSASVTLPPQYGFSFEAERTLVKFAPGSLGPLAGQLGEVKTISEILYAAKINSLDGIRRVRVSDDDARGPQSDYLDESAVSNNPAIFTPYEVTFRCFSQDLANALSVFASSPHGFVVKDINVQAMATTAAPSASPLGGGVSGNQLSPYTPPGQPAYRPPSAPIGRGGLQTVLDEQILSITMKIEIVKLMPGI
jgi:hypothetical protein